MEILGYFLAIIIGITLGLVGAGGSILSIPLLVYIFKIDANLATTYSLFIVGCVAFYGTVKHRQLGNLNIKTAVFFAIPSVISTLFIRNIVLKIIPIQFAVFDNFTLSKNGLIMIAFAILMLSSALLMIKKQAFVTKEKVEINYLKLSIIGFLIGAITGFLGAGGGFLIIPALIFFANLPMKQAVGTSLLIIFINSTIGFSSDLFNNVVLNYYLLFIITFVALLGMFIGTEISKKINGNKLKPAFGWFVLAIGIYIISKEILFK